MVLNETAIYEEMLDVRNEFLEITKNDSIIPEISDRIPEKINIITRLTSSEYLIF